MIFFFLSYQVRRTFAGPLWVQTSQFCLCPPNAQKLVTSWKNSDGQTTDECSETQGGKFCLRRRLKTEHNQWNWINERMRHKKIEELEKKTRKVKVRAAVKKQKKTKKKLQLPAREFYIERKTEFCWGRKSSGVQLPVVFLCGDILK